MTIHVNFAGAADALAGENINITTARPLGRPLRIAHVNIMGDPANALIDDLRAFGGADFDGNVQFDSFSPDSRLAQAQVLLQAAKEPETTPDGTALSGKFHRAHHRVNFHDGFSALIQSLDEYDGVILTGFPREEADLVQKSEAHPNGVEFYDEFTGLLDALRQNNVPTLATCWSAHVALKHLHGVDRPTPDMKNKITGIFPSEIRHGLSPLTDGLPAQIDIPVSRFGASDQTAIENHPELLTLAMGERSSVGSAIAAEKTGSFYFMTGHLEYGAQTLKREYLRDAALAASGELDTAPVPANYNLENPQRTWAGAAKTFYGNVLQIFNDRYQMRFKPANDADWTAKIDQADGAAASL